MTRWLRHLWCAIAHHPDRRYAVYRQANFFREHSFMVFRCGVPGCGEEWE